MTTYHTIRQNSEDKKRAMFTHDSHSGASLQPTKYLNVVTQTPRYYDFYFTMSRKPSPNHALQRTAGGSLGVL